MTGHIENTVELQAAEAYDPDAEERRCWELWYGAREESARALLLARHMPYAHTVAAVYFSRRTHREIEFADYLQFASVGLIEALDRFDPSRGVVFRTYAARRMHGAILDGVERLSDRYQQVALRRRLERERSAALRDEPGSPGGGGALISGPGLFDRLAEVGIGMALGVLLEGTGMVSPPGEVHEEDAAAHAAPLQVSYFRQSEIGHLRRLVRDLLSRLTPPEQQVIRYHYLQDTEFAEIARILNVSRGRVAQLHRSGLDRLREEMSRRRLRDVAW